MEVYERCSKEKRSNLNKKHSSFSSSLLDTIYRSIDEREVGFEEAKMVFYRETVSKKQSSDRAEEKKKKTQKVEFRQKQSDSEDSSRRSQRIHKPIFFKSSSSSSESSYGGFGYSSSETVSIPSQLPKPIRTGFRHEKPLQPTSEKTQFPRIQSSASMKEKPLKRDGFIQTKPAAPAASKICSDSKKAGQPTSPGGRIASFLNSLFTSNSKKAKIDDSRSRLAQMPSSSSTTPTCSSASSYSRSCLSKTPSSRGNSTNGTKRSVRFYPVGVIVDEDCRPCGQKCIYDKSRDYDPTVGRKTGVSKASIGEELKLHLMEKSRQIEEAAKDLLKEYQKKSDLLQEVMRSMHGHGGDDGHGGHGDDDDGYSSSDLFELEIGSQRYREELPVYETTRLGTNRAIVSGLIR